MAERIPARLTAEHGRRFGVTVGAAFLVIAGLLWWRNQPTAMLVPATLGGLLVVAGLLIPTHLGPVERAWMALAHLISKVTTPIVMGVMYLGVLTPTALLRRKVGRNPLVHPQRDRSYWRPRPEGARRSASMERQF